MKTRITIMLALAACLTSCATPQPEQHEKPLTQERVERFIVKGKTTKNEVIAEFGPPSTTTITNMSLPATVSSAVPYETLSYSKVNSMFPVHVSTLLVQLDRRGIVVGYIFSGQ